MHFSSYLWDSGIGSCQLHYSLESSTDFINKYVVQITGRLKKIEIYKFRLNGN